MRAKGTWVLMFFILGTLAVAAVLSHAFSDIFNWLHVSNSSIVGDALHLSAALGGGIAIVLGLFFGLFYTKSRRYVEQVVVELAKLLFLSGKKLRWQPLPL